MFDIEKIKCGFHVGECKNKPNIFVILSRKNYRKLRSFCSIHFPFYLEQEASLDFMNGFSVNKMNKEELISYEIIDE